jgi:hypothetical protein
VPINLQFAFLSATPIAFRHRLRVEQFVSHFVGRSRSDMHRPHSGVPPVSLCTTLNFDAFEYCSELVQNLLTV